MKKLISLVTALSILASVSTFAQYGGGGGGVAYVNNGGNSSFALNRDICSNGDKSPSYYDGTCGDILIGNDLTTSDLLVTGPMEEKKILTLPNSADIIVVNEDNLIAPGSLPETGVTARSSKRIMQIITNSSPVEVVDGLMIPAFLPETGVK